MRYSFRGAKRPRDPVQLAKQVFDIAIGEAEDTVSEPKRQPVSKRRAGGLKGGKAKRSISLLNSAKIFRDLQHRQDGKSQATQIYFCPFRLHLLKFLTFGYVVRVVHHYLNGGRFLG